MSLTASSTFGTAPFVTTFNGTVSSNDSYGLDFGDGSSGIGLSIYACSPTSPSNCVFGPFSHTYTSAGIYTATLKNSRGTTLGSVKITVSGPIFTATPTSGYVPLSVKFTSNRTGTIYFGDGASHSVVPVGLCNGPCTVRPGTVSHTYTYPGIYTATLKDPSDNALSTATITVMSSMISIAPLVYPHGVVGSRVYLIGKGFSYKDSNNVYFGTTLVGSRLQAWNDGGNPGFQDLAFTLRSLPIGAYPVTVQNENGTGGPNDSNGNPLVFTVVASPTISAAVPLTVAEGQSLTITGTGFDQNGVTIRIMPPSGDSYENPATPQGNRASVVIGSSIAPGPYYVEVRNTASGYTSNALPITVIASTSTNTSK